MVTVGDEEIDVDEDKVLVELCDIEDERVRPSVTLVTGVTVFNTVADTEDEGEILAIEDDDR